MAGTCSRSLRATPSGFAAIPFTMPIPAALAPTPSSSKPLADVFDDAYEDPRTRSDTVQVGGQCWLNGTVNYGTYGIMVRLCSDAFPFKFALALTMAETPDQNLQVCWTSPGRRHVAARLASRHIHWQPGSEARECRQSTAMQVHLPVRRQRH
jgi:hypothetical protein